MMCLPQSNGEKAILESLEHLVYRFPYLELIPERIMAMAWKEVTYKLMSECPMLMHNGQTADPLNKFSKAMKQVSGRRKKTDADYEELARIEFLAALYMGPNGPIIPAANFDSMILGAAKKSREGPTAKSGIFCAEDMELVFDGPRTVDELWKDECFRHVAIVRINTNRVVRTRPVFKEWSGSVRLNIESSIVNVERLDDWMFVAGTQIGLGDWRPQHGRFTVERLSE